MNDEEKEAELQANDPGFREVKGACSQDLKAVQEASPQGAAEAQTNPAFPLSGFIFQVMKPLLLRRSEVNPEDDKINSPSLCI